MFKRILVGAGAAVLAFSVQADYIARQGKDYVRIMETPCDASVLQHIPEQAHPMFLGAVAEMNGKSYRACWTMFQQTGAHLFVVYEDADTGLIPLGDLKEAQGV